MGEDLSVGARIGVVLILLCAIISIVFSIMSIMKNITTQGTEDLQNSLSSMSLQKFDDYDQRTVTGAQVVSACKLLQDQPYAIVVYTNRANSSTVYGLQDCTWVGENINIGTDAKMSAISSAVYDTTEKRFKFADTLGYAVGAMPGGDKFTYNNNRTKMNERTDPQYVSNSSKFKSYLIKTTSGDIMGLVFDEV